MSHASAGQYEVVISAVEMDESDLYDFRVARDALKLILDRHLSKEWTFKDKEHPAITFEGVHFWMKK